MIRILQDFVGYPDGSRRRAFKSGEQPQDLPAGYEDLLIQKGHASSAAETKKVTK